jgi:hypothetical protein
MKEPIEELIKESLGGHEMSYRPEAWDAMRARLDIVSPVATPRSYFKYYIAAAGLGLTAVAAFVIFTHESVTEDAIQPQIVQNETNPESTSSESNVSVKDNAPTKTSTDGSATTINTPENSQTSSTNGNSSTTKENDPIAAVVMLNPHGFVNDPNAAPGNPISTSTIALPTPILAPIVSKEMIIPVIPGLCMNEPVKVENVNDQMIMILAPDGTLTGVPAGKVIIYQAKMQGMHGIGFMENDDFYSESTFNVRQAPDSEFSMDKVNKFSSGVPATHVIANTTSYTYTWKTNTAIVAGAEADLHFYKKGNQTVELTVSNGVCSSTTEQSIYIEEYLLMAVNSFDPNGNDPRNRTFMPFALTQRDANFNLVIIDSRDGGIVYETSESDLPWDGIDKRTGKQERGITTYIWKVVLYNPELNEPGEYIGTITKL